MEKSLKNLAWHLGVWLIKLSSKSQTKDIIPVLNCQTEFSPEEILAWQIEFDRMLKQQNPVGFWVQ